MDNEPIPSGILPTRLLLPKLRTWRLEQFVMVAGMFPVKELLEQFVMVAGMFPVKELL
uniref:Uncharacterized protein n=1 Tax=Helianthus annuus TaxID=4232 RepID=A0A251UEP7_HELAN